MNLGPATNRQLARRLILSAVLVLGIIQWSFLPILIQSASLPGRDLLEVSNGHVSKFAAPFKCLFGDFQKPGLPVSRISEPRNTSNCFHRFEESTPNWQDLFFSYRQLRAPPSA
jgi:hypothetical protein